jgi:hypothetical protein
LKVTGGHEMILPAMSKSEIIKRVGGYFPQFEKAVRKGFESHPRSYSDTAEVHSKRTQANLRHDHMMRAASETLPRKAFRRIHVGNRDLFSYLGEILVQFKKFNRKVMTSNYPTPQADRFDQFGEIGGLPGLLFPLPLVTVGYVAREGHGLEGIFITRIVNHRPEWVERLDKNDEDEQQPPIISILPNDPTTPTPSRIRRIPRRTPPATGSTES